MKKTAFHIIFSALLGLSAVSAETDCSKLTIGVKAAITADQGKILEIVSKEISASPACACEVVKAAIEASSANAETVALIVEAAIHAAPDQMRLISQCAVAVAPDALANVQAVMAKLDPNRGEGAAVKSAKDAKAPAGEVAAMPNPLDLPGTEVPGNPPVIETPPGRGDNTGSVTEINPRLSAQKLKL